MALAGNIIRGVREDQRTPVMAHLAVFIGDNRCAAISQTSIGPRPASESVARGMGVVSRVGPDCARETGVVSSFLARGACLGRE